MLIPERVITEPDWKCQIQPCVDMYSDDLPSRRTLDAELRSMGTEVDKGVGRTVEKTSTAACRGNR